MSRPQGRRAAAIRSTTWVALLRGVNVGGHRVAMKELARHLEAAGFTRVATYIQSGNIVFDAGETNPAEDVAALVEKHFGFRPAVFCLAPSELRDALDNAPFAPAEGKLLHFFFCDRRPEIDYAWLESLRSPTEEYRLVGTVFYLHAPDGIGRSRLVEKMGRAFPGITMTARNLNTVQKLCAMVAGR